MNLQYLRYALEISRTGSISKAAENLSVAQPNLSRAVKELESSLGITVFDRTRTGMTVTPEGEKLLSAGERILRDVADLETMFDGEEAPREILSIVVPHAVYLAHAFARFCRDLPPDGRYDLTYREAGPTDAIGAIARGECRMGIIRHPLHFDRYIAEKLSAHELLGETIAEFSPVVTAGAGSPIAARASVTAADLKDLCEIRSPDTPGQETSDGLSDTPCRLTITDRAARLDLLYTDPSTYERTLPMPPEAADRAGLIIRPLSIPGTRYRDVFIHPKSYRLTPTDRRLLDMIRETAALCTGT